MRCVAAGVSMYVCQVKSSICVAINLSQSQRASQARIAPTCVCACMRACVHVFVCGVSS